MATYINGDIISVGERASLWRGRRCVLPNLMPRSDNTFQVIHYKKCKFISTSEFHCPSFHISKNMEYAQLLPPLVMTLKWYSNLCDLLNYACTNIVNGMFSEIVFLAKFTGTIKHKEWMFRVLYSFVRQSQYIVANARMLPVLNDLHSLVLRIHHV